MGSNNLELFLPVFSLTRLRQRFLSSAFPLLFGQRLQLFEDRPTAHSSPNKLMPNLRQCLQSFESRSHSLSPPSGVAFGFLGRRVRAAGFFSAGASIASGSTTTSGTATVGSANTGAAASFFVRLLPPRPRRFTSGAAAVTPSMDAGAEPCSAAIGSLRGEGVLLRETKAPDFSSRPSSSKPRA